MAVPNLLPQAWHTEVRKARKARRMSQREVAERTGIHQTQLSRIENGVVDARVSDAIQMARAVELEFVLVPRRALPTVYRLMTEHMDDGPRPSAVELLVGRGDGE